jgi:hypothetical protein
MIFYVFIFDFVKSLLYILVVYCSIVGHVGVTDGLIKWVDAKACDYNLV